MNAASSPVTSLSNPSTSAGSSGFGGALGAWAATTSAPGCGDAPSSGGEVIARPDAGLPPTWSNGATEVAMSSKREVAASSLRKRSVSEGAATRFVEGRREAAMGAEGVGGRGGLAAL
jgi:hypothetical protein